MNNDTKACREAFEGWHSHIFEQHLPSLRREYGYPKDFIVETRWQAWNFSWQARAEQDRAALKEVREALVVGIGDILFLANERQELDRFQGTVTQLSDALATLDKLLGEKP